MSDTENREFLQAELKIVEGELKELEAERDRLLIMRDHYRKRLGLPVAETKAHANVKSQGQSSIQVMTFNKGDFFGLPHAQAAYEVLKRSGGTLTTDQILKIFQDTGYEVGGVNPKRTLYVSLARSSKMVLVASNTFDLAERRPNVKKTRKKSVKKKKSKNKEAK